MTIEEIQPTLSKVYDLDQVKSVDYEEAQDDLGDYTVFIIKLPHDCIVRQPFTKDMKVIQINIYNRMLDYYSFRMKEHQGEAKKIAGKIDDLQK